MFMGGGLWLFDGGLGMILGCFGMFLLGLQEESVCVRELNS